MKAAFNIIINNSYGPLLHALPLSLADKTYGAAPSNTERERESEDGAAVAAAGGKTSAGSSLEDQGSSKKDPAGPNSTAKAKTEEDYGFAHPAASRPQRTVWLPVDTLGISQEEERACREAGVDVSSKDAQMNEKGKVDIRGAPPDLIREE